MPAIEALHERLTSNGLTARRLAVSAAFHSPLMRAAEAPMHDFLATLELTAPHIDVYANEDAALYDGDPAAIRRTLARHPGAPVRFHDQIEAMYAAGVRTFVEVGPGAVLTGLIGRILGPRPHKAVNLDRRGRNGVTTFHEALARLALHGVPMHPPPAKDPTPKPKPQMPVRVNGTGYLPPKPTPPAPPASPASAQPALRPAPAPEQPQPALLTPSPSDQARPAAWVSSPSEPAGALPLAPESGRPDSFASSPSEDDRRAAVVSSPSDLAPSAPVAPPPSEQGWSAPKSPSAFEQGRPLPLGPSAPDRSRPTSIPSTPLEPFAPMTEHEPSAEWLAAVQEMQRQTAEAHMHFQRVLADSHQAFLQMAENTFAAFAGRPLRPGQSPVPAPAPRVPQSHPLDPQRMDPPPTDPQRMAPAPDELPVLHRPSPLPPSQSTVGRVADAEPVSLGLLLSVVADKTGYPVDMLNGGMDLESDLGIDSIKRVEIFAAVRERAEGLPATESAQMASLLQARTLDDVMRGVTAEPSEPRQVRQPPQSAVAGRAAEAGAAAGVGAAPGTAGTGAPPGAKDAGGAGTEGTGRGPGAMLPARPRQSPVAAPAQIVPEPRPFESYPLQPSPHGLPVRHRRAPTHPASLPVEGVAGAETVSLGLLLSVVADKTGYPVDMLNGGMDLESDLGIDSIKKVEIFAAVRERAEGLPSTESAQMASLFKARTLDDVMRGVTAKAGQVLSTPQAGEPPESAEPRRAGEAGRAAEAGQGRREAQAAPGLQAPGIAEAGLSRLQVRPVVAPACGLALAGLWDGPVAVVDGGSALAPAVVEQLRARGIMATAEDGPSSDTHGVILLGGLAPAADAGRAARDAFRAARAVAGGMAERGGVFVTVQDTGGCFGLVEPDPQRAWLGGFAALTRTAALEWPAVAAKAIDCERGGRSSDKVAAAIVAELLTGGPTLDVGLRADGTRWTLVDSETGRGTGTETDGDRGGERRSRMGSETSRRAEGVVEGEVGRGVENRSAVGGGSVLVVSGGGRGVTAAALLALAATGPTKMLLLGRTVVADEPEFLGAARDEPALIRLLAEHEPTATPAGLTGRARSVLAGREVRATLDGLARAGATVRYAAVDVKDRVALERELAQVRREWGAVTGLVHAAGVLADKRIVDKTDEQFDRVYATKVDGLRALLDATAADPLEMICLFSSVAARFGNPGQCDYAMANEVLNQVALAERRRRPSCRVRAIGWGPWDAGMVTAAHAAQFRDRGVPLIGLDAGARAFVAELSTPGDAVQVLITGGPGAGPGRPRWAAEATVDARTHGFLADHAPAGVPVLPLAMALEWFAALGSARAPGPIALAGLRVLHRIELPGLETGGHHFTIEATPAGHLSIGNHYRARLTTTEPPRAWTTPTSMEPFTALYESAALFHGPRFQVLREVRGLTRDGAEARVASVRAADWPDRPWWTDPAAVDGALQTAVLWAEHATGHATLPLGVDTIRVHRPGPAPAMLRCLVRATAVSTDQMRCDIALLDEDGGVRTELLGVSLIRRPDLAPA